MTQRANFRNSTFFGRDSRKNSPFAGPRLLTAPKRFERIPLGPPDVNKSSLKKSRLTLEVLTIAALLVAFFVCFRLLRSGPALHLASYQEVRRFESPDHSLDAIVYTTDVGATTSKGFHVALVAIDAEPTFADDVFVIDNTDSDEPVNVRWASPGLLDIKVGPCQVIKQELTFRNAVSSVVVRYSGLAGRQVSFATPHANAPRTIYN